MFTAPLKVRRLAGWKAEEIVRQGVAHVPQGRGTLTDLTVDENLRIGAYTRKLLEQMGLASILERHTVSNEPNVTGITSKVALGSADAGFAYRTDARAAGDGVRTIALPATTQPPIQYLMCAVRRPGANTRGAQAFVDKVTGRDGQRILSRWGFGLPAPG